MELFRTYREHLQILGSLSSDVFELCTSTGSEPFSLLVSLAATVFVLPSVLILIETICLKICSKSRLTSAKSPFPVDVRRSKTSLLKLPNNRPLRKILALSGKKRHAYKLKVGRYNIRENFVLDHVSLGAFLIPTLIHDDITKLLKKNVSL